MPKNGDNERSIERLLNDLQTPGNTRAWHSFLDQYAPTLFGIARKYADTEEAAHDCFLYVCEKLCTDDCSRLQKFESGRGTSLRTWLIAIANNLCIDWHRGLFGRSTTPAAIRALPELEQLTYRYRVEQSLDLDTCLLALRRFYPDLSRARMSQASASVHAALSPKQRWRISARTQRGHVSLDELRKGYLPEDPGDDPGRSAATAQEQKALRCALSMLTPRKRLILRLRFEQELSLKEVARVAGLGDLHQARRLIQGALEELREYMVASRLRT